MLLGGLHHVAFLSGDLDRLIGFYERVLDARVTMDLSEEGLRHAFIDVGQGTVLHPFEIAGTQPPAGPGEIFRRGRLDHFALRAPDEAAFRELHRRVRAEGSQAGEPADMGSVWTFSFLDPDGMWLEVTLDRPGVPHEASRRELWRPLEL